MDDLNATQRELAETINRINSDLSRLGYVSKSTADELAAGGKANNERLKAAANTVIDSFAAVTGGSTSYAQALTSGKKTASQFNDAVSGASKGLEGLATLLFTFSPAGRIGAALKALAVGLGFLAKATEAGIKIQTGYFDKMAKGYNDMAKFGAGASDGLSGVMETAHKLGFTLAEVDDMVAVFAENAADLALFGGTVMDGRKMIANLGSEIMKDMDLFVKFGYTTKDVTELQLQYMRQQRNLGRLEKLTQEELAAGTKAYMYELDAITKLTGQTRKQQEDQLEEARSEEQFYGKIMELRETGNEKAAQQMEAMIKGLPKNMAKLVMKSVGGTLTADESVKATMLFKGENLRVAQDIESRSIDAFEGIRRLTVAAGETIKSGGSFMSKMGTFVETYGISAYEAEKFAKLQYTPEKIAQIREEQAKTEKDLGDQLLKTQGDLVKSTTDAGRELDKFAKQTFDAANSIAGIVKANQEIAKGGEALRKAFKELTGWEGPTTITPAKFEQGVFDISKANIRIKELDKKLENPDLSEVEKKSIVEEQSQLASMADKGFPAMIELQKATEKNLKRFTYLEQVDLARQRKEIDREIKFKEAQIKSFGDVTGLPPEHHLVKRTEKAIKELEDLKRKQPQSKHTEAIKNIKESTQHLFPGATALATPATAAAAAAPAPAPAPAETTAAPAPAAPAAPAASAAQPVFKPGVSLPPREAARQGTIQAQNAGLRIRDQGVTAGGPLTEKALNTALAIQRAFGENFGFFTGLNDLFGRDSPLHREGRAIDFTLREKPKDAKYAAEIKSMLAGMPNVQQALDEYFADKTARTTGGHFHVGVQAKQGAILSGPDNGYQPNLTMHGTEAVIPLKNGMVPVDSSLITDITDTLQANDQGALGLQVAEINDLRNSIDRMSDTINSGLSTFSDLQRDMLSSLADIRRINNITADASVQMARIAMN